MIRPTHRRRSRGPRRARRAAAAALTAAAAALAAAGCGIRGTSLPVDAGPAPSRVSCEVSGGSTPVPESSREAVAEAFLVCSTQIMPVKRLVRQPGQGTGDGTEEERRLGSARTLLAELQARPSAAEAEGGFSTEVPDGLEVAPAREGDPDGTVRLSRFPDELPPYALVQLVCTFAGTPATGGAESAVLGGPGDAPLERFSCTDELRAQPESAQNSGTRVE